MAQVVREAVAAYIVEKRATAPAPTSEDEDLEIEPISEEDLTPEELEELKKNPRRDRDGAATGLSPGRLGG